MIINQDTNNTNKVNRNVLPIRVNKGCCVVLDVDVILPRVIRVIFSPHLAVQ